MMDERSQGLYQIVLQNSEQGGRRAALNGCADEFQILKINCGTVGDQLEILLFVRMKFKNVFFCG